MAIDDRLKLNPASVRGLRQALKPMHVGILPQPLIRLVDIGPLERVYARDGYQTAGQLWAAQLKISSGLQASYQARSGRAA